MHVDLMRDERTIVPALDTAIDSLRVWHCKYRSLGPLAALRDLRMLVIATVPDDTLSMLRPLHALRYLSILHLPKITDLSPLEELQQLEVLELQTLPSWDSSGRVTEVASLAPLARLRSLRHLALFGVVPVDRSLREVERCSSLKSARFSKYPRAEVERFYRDTRVSDAHVPRPEAG